MLIVIGIVLVSHSLRLAEGLADLLAQIGSRSVPIVIAAGTDDGRLGTNPDRVA
jgi:PTS hybrid protein